MSYFPLFLIPNHFPHPSAFEPSPCQLPLHTCSSLSVSGLLSPVSSSTGPRARKSGNEARKEGICREKVPPNASEMWFPIRLSKVELQARAIQAVAAATEAGMFTSRQNLNPYYAPCEIFGAGGEQKTPDLKEFLMGQTGETQVIHKKAKYLLC